MIGSQRAGMTKIYVVFYEHKTPGEGFRGFEWDYSLNALRLHMGDVRTAIEDGDYNVRITTAEIESVDQDDITDEIDHFLWENPVR